MQNRGLVPALVISVMVNLGVVGAAGYRALVQHGWGATELAALLKLDAGRIFAMGHGDGAIIANQLACLRGNILRGVGPFGGAGPVERAGASCIGKVAALVGHNPNEGDAVQCGRVTGGSCPWSMIGKRGRWLN